MDLYSAGAMFFALMSGTPLPFERNGYSEGLQQPHRCRSKSRQGAHYSSDDDSCCTWLALLQECLQQSPELRPTAACLRGVLEQLLESVRADEEVLSLHLESADVCP
jgi:hypothetical protein